MILAVCSLTQLISMDYSLFYSRLHDNLGTKDQHDDASINAWLQDQFAVLSRGATTLETVHQQCAIRFNLSIDLDNFRTMYQSVLVIKEEHLARFQSLALMLHHHPNVRLFFIATMSSAHFSLLINKVQHELPLLKDLLELQMVFGQSTKAQSNDPLEIVNRTLTNPSAFVQMISFLEDISRFNHPSFVCMPCHDAAGVRFIINTLTVASSALAETAGIKLKDPDTVDADSSSVALAEAASTLTALPTQSVMLPFDQDDIVPQHGGTCKLTAIASLDRFFAHRNRYPAIPVFKNTQGVYGSEERAISLRQLAKQVGSIQGELLEISQVTTLLTQSLGYQCAVVDLTDEAYFRSRVIEELNQGQPCIIFFYVDHREEKEFHGKAIVSDNEVYEHACLITGYDALKDTLRITHWDQHFDVPVNLFYQSNQSLKNTRGQEHYRSTKVISQLLLGFQSIYSRQRKFNLADRDDLMPFALALQHHQGVDPELVLDLAQTVPDVGTIIPKQGSGFQGKMICIKAPSLDEASTMQSNQLRLNSFSY